MLFRSRQIENIIAPKKIANTFLNYFIKSAVTGGLCTAFVHGKLDSNTVINEHLNYIQQPNIKPDIWPNITLTQPWSFNELPNGISTVDIRSLYPSASVKRIPVNSPLFYSRFTRNDYVQICHQQLKTYDLHSFCLTTQQQGSFETDQFHLLNDPPRFYHEYAAIKHYLNSLPSKIGRAHV